VHGGETERPEEVPLLGGGFQAGESGTVPLAGTSSTSTSTSTS